MLWWRRKEPDFVENLPGDDPEFWTFMARRPDSTDTDGMRRWIDEAMARWPTYPYIHLFSAIVRRAEGDTNGRLADLAVALALDPDDPVLYKHVAYVLRDAGRAELVEPVLAKGWEAWERLLAHGRLRMPEGEREKYFDLDRQPPDGPGVPEDPSSPGPCEAI